MRNRLALFCALLVFVAMTVPVRAAGTVVLTADNLGGGLVQYTFAWTSTAGGAVSANAQALVRGRLVEIEIIPASGGTQPTDLYDMTLVDENGVDLLNGRGANRSNATSERFQWDPPSIHAADDDLDLVVANAGNAKAGTVKLWIQQ
jgi:hypothetical protein